MRICWLKTLLLVAISLPPGGLTAPCSEKRCSAHSLVTRKAEAAIIPIIPLPKPVVPPIKPFPIPPKPITPKPIAPKPVSPKPVEPAPPSSGVASQCKRAPGDPCTVAPFGDAELERVRNKGRIAQADLLETQRANPPAQDVDRADISSKYNHPFMNNQVPPLEEDEIEFLKLHNLPVRYSEENNWYSSSTLNLEGGGTELPKPILVTHTNPETRGMVIAESFKDNDQLVSGKMHWSDMAMFDLKRAFEDAGVKVDELQYMLRNSIFTGNSAKATKGYIQNAITHTKGDVKTVNTFRSDPDAPGITPEELAAYQLLAGSDHVHRVLLMLKDYPATMKNVRVESLSVTTDQTAGAAGEYNILIKFTKVDNP